MKYIFIAAMFLIGCPVPVEGLEECREECYSKFLPGSAKIVCVNVCLNEKNKEQQHD